METSAGLSEPDSADLASLPQAVIRLRRGSASRKSIDLIEKTSDSPTSTSPNPSIADTEGLLGELEQAVMEAIWLRGEASVRQIQGDLAAREPAYTTVMTVMARLSEKGVLEREKRGRAFLYRPVQSDRAGFLRQQARQGVRRLLDRFGDLALAGLVDELAGTPDQIDALERLLDAHQDERSGAKE
jgi:predicted transcriptional regulator